MSVESSAFNVGRSAPKGAVFLSYASQDAAAAARLCAALRSAGVEVWFDQNELVGGDAWDAKIRKQIADCALFVPIISANTQARREGYFRLEWKLAAQRTHMIADGTPFLLPVVIDDTHDASALVPVEFRAVQWTRLRQAYGGQDRQGAAEGGEARQGATDGAQARGGGDAMRMFVERVGTLLQAGAPLPAISVTAGTPVGHGGGLAGTPARERRVPWIALAAVAAVAVLALGFWLAARRAAPASASAPTVRQQSDEVRRLLTQARELIYDPDSARNEFALAESLLKRVADLAPDAGEVWGASALLNHYFNSRGYDQSAQRLVLSQADAEKALRLEPRNADALLALGLHRRQMKDEEGARGFLNRAREADPQNPKVYVALALQIPNLAERAAFLQEAAGRVSNNTELLYYAVLNLAWSRQRWKALEVADRLLTRKPFWRVYQFRAVLEWELTGDTASAWKWLNQVPEVKRDELRVVVLRFKLAMAQRDGAKAVQLLEASAADYFQDNAFTGPKAFLLAQAHELAGQSARALEQWQTAERRLRERLTASPGDISVRTMLAIVLVALQRTAEARELADACGADDRLEQIRNDYVYLEAMVYLAQAYARLGDSPRAIALLRRALGVQGVPTIGLTSAGLAADPSWDPLRARDDFQGLLREFAEVRPAGAQPETEKPSSTESAPSKSASAHGDKSIAVLAFANLSDDKANEGFADSLSAELRDVLSTLPGLKVVARTSAFAFKGKNVPITEVAKQLGVGYVVDGTVNRAGNRVRISVQLIKAADGIQVWGDKFNRELKDMFAVQDEIANLVARALQLRLASGAGQALTRGGTQNPAAYEAYIKGRQDYNNAASTNHRSAIDHLLTAVQLDPNFALAHGALAEAYTAQANVGAEPAARMFPLARAAAERALALDRGIVEAYTALGEIAFHYDWDYEKSDEFLKQALVVDPNYAGAHARLAGHFNARGRFEEALAAIQRAKELDPLEAQNSSAWTLLLMKRPSEAIAAAREHLARFPEAAFTAVALGGALLSDGKPGDAMRVFEELVTKMPGEPWAMTMLCWGYGRSGQTAKARELLGQLKAIAASRHVSPLYLAIAASGIDDRELAFAQLERAFELRDPHLPDLGVGPLFVPIQDDPRYRAMLKRLKLDRYFLEAAKP